MLNNIVDPIYIDDGGDKIPMLVGKVTSISLVLLTFTSHVTPAKLDHGAAKSQR